MADKTQGLVCPWCPGAWERQIRLSNCPHNPFTLMRENRQMRDELDTRSEKLLRVEAFVDALRVLLAEEDTP